MNQAPAGFKISPYLQDLALQVGQAFPFQQASDWLFKLAKVDLDAKQIERLTHHYGQQVEEHPLPSITEQEGLHYCMLDGGMILTRPSQWREMKVGRIVKSTDITPLIEKRNQINHSVYLAHLGDCEAFFEKFAHHTDSLAHKIFLADGAQWIWDKVSERYPGSVQILDYYHLWERFCGFAALHFADPAQGSAWLENQQACLFSDQIGQIVANLLTEQAQPESAKESQQKLAQLITYVLNNLERIRYGTFRKQGYWMGSGAMEAAHRTLVQHRLKRSGQRWTPIGNKWSTCAQLIKVGNGIEITQLIQAA